MPVIVSCFRSCLCGEKYASWCETFLSGITSFLAFLGALMVVLAFKCDAQVLLQAGVGACIGVLGATFFQVVFVVYLLVVTCRDTDGCSCGSRLWTVVTFAFQIIAAILGAILSTLPGRSPFSLYVCVEHGRNEK